MHILLAGTAELGLRAHRGNTEASLLRRSIAVVVPSAFGARSATNVTEHGYCRLASPMHVRACPGQAAGAGCWAYSAATRVCDEESVGRAHPKEPILLL